MRSAHLHGSCGGGGVWRRDGLQLDYSWIGFSTLGPELCKPTCDDTMRQSGLLHREGRRIGYSSASTDELLVAQVWLNLLL